MAYHWPLVQLYENHGWVTGRPHRHQMNSVDLQRLGRNPYSVSGAEMDPWPGGPHVTVNTSPREGYERQHNQKVDDHVPGGCGWGMFDAADRTTFVYGAVKGGGRCKRDQGDSQPILDHSMIKSTRIPLVPPLCPIQPMDFSSERIVSPASIPKMDRTDASEGSNLIRRRAPVP